MAIAESRPKIPKVRTSTKGCLAHLVTAYLSMIFTMLKNSTDIIEKRSHMI
jgi:hypothetical protein